MGHQLEHKLERKRYLKEMKMGMACNTFRGGFWGELREAESS